MVAYVLLIGGSMVFLVGAAIGVPRVFMEPDPDARLRLLRARPRAWRWAQPLYAGGPLLAAAGVVVLAAGAGHLGTAGGGGRPGTAGGAGQLDGAGAAPRALVAAAGAALVVGALAWARSVHQRTVRVADFAHGRLPGWPFTTYVLLTVAGLALLGAGLLAGGFPAWLGWLVLAADAMFLAAYLRLRDLPPFVFYLLLLTVGSALV
jgi:hypothetical protein